MKPIRLARFASNSQIETFWADIEETEYIAVSHVWSNTRWQKIESFAEEILVSDHKAEFLTGQLPLLVGDVPFWMDVICIDQRDSLARKAIVGSIPVIFRLAIKTIAVRDGDGLRQCCIDGIGDFKSWKEEAIHSLCLHFRRNHHEDYVLETYLDRLWTLQEILFSDALQFADCSAKPLKLTERPEDYYLWKIDFDRIEDGIYTLGHTWLRYGGGPQTDNEQDLTDFARAFLTLGTVSRPPRTQPLQDIGNPENLFYAFFLNSIRAATASSDYVLSSFPQFGWYKLPSAFKSMSFFYLFIDAYDQARAAGHGFIPRITRSMTLGCHCDDPWEPSADIPVPSTLGDFLKLMGNTAWHSPLTKAAFTTEVVVQDVTANTNLARALYLIGISIDHAWSTWVEAHRGELSLFGSWPSESPFGESLYFGMSDATHSNNPEYRRRITEIYVDNAWERLDHVWVEQECRRILDCLYSSKVSLRYRNEEDVMTREWKHYERWLLERDPPFYHEVLLMLAAMVNCRIPLSAYAWARQHFQPVMVSFYMGPLLLGLLSKHSSHYVKRPIVHNTICRDIPNWVGMQAFIEFMPCSSIVFCAERISKRRWPSGQNLVLVDRDTRSPIGLLPDFMQAHEEDQVFTQRLIQLYHGAQKTRHDQVHLMFNRIEHVQVSRDTGFFYDPELQSITQEQIQKILSWQGLSTTPTTGWV